MHAYDFEFFLKRSKEVGYVEQVTSSLVLVRGLPGVTYGEVVVFENGFIGYVWGFTREHVQILYLSNSLVQSGIRVTRSGNLLKIRSGEFLLGRTINAAGEIIGDPEVGGQSDGQERELFGIVPELLDRDIVHESFATGVSLVDLVVPLGKGQRQLVIGDRKTGKTDFLAQVIKMQKNTGVICVYAAIGKRLRDIADLKRQFAIDGMKERTVFVQTSASESAALAFLNPYTALSIAEYFKDQGKDVLLILDDMTSHAVSYRELSLSARRFPGRDSYPGDIFYIHSQILERAGKFRTGSITCLPVAEMVMGELSGFIQTNLMSMTDGHIFFDGEFKSSGREPAINHFLSVTRVGLQAQTPLIREIARSLSQLLSRHKELSDFAHFGAESTPEVRKILTIGDKIYSLLTQDIRTVRDQLFSAFIFCCIVSDVWDNKSPGQIEVFVRDLNQRFVEDVQFKKLVSDQLSILNTIDEVVSLIKKGTYNNYLGV